MQAEAHTSISQDDIKAIAQAVVKAERLNLRVIPLATVVALLVQFGGMVWWAAQMQARVDTQGIEIRHIHEQVDSGMAVYLTRQEVDDILGARDAEIKAIKEYLVRIDAKLDKISNGH